ncbi:MAG: hypothetical protein Unbinned3459contig1000_111 [Prokaryotic dsDNA virus sp.]|jgi:hypothetical protein|nr:MAG: hypothetical protein Unbinned3459contig1000_111 [Prokaryotic dsDNA virus sp.]|tara:strand:+ start:50130 stop:51302 length:1173 start_codon:yes stop_codon:yes gene_type:complete
MTSSYNPMQFGGIGGRRVPAAQPFVMPSFNAPPGPWNQAVPTSVSPASIITRSAPKQVVQQGGKTVLKQGARGVGRFLGPAVDLGYGAYEAQQAAKEGRNPLRQLAKTATGAAAGGLAVAGGGMVGVPTTGPVGAAAAIGLYTPTSLGAEALFDVMFPEQVTKKDDFVYGRTPGTFQPKKNGKGVDFLPGQDVIGPVPQPRTGKGGFVVVPKKEGGGIRWDPNFDQSSIYKKEPVVQETLPPFNPNQDLPASAEQSVDTAPFQHQMAIYEQGRNAAQTQAERNQVRDLGLAIHKAHNPQLYSNFQTPMASDRTFNPLMANMFPDTYPQTREAFIQERGVQMPQTMTNVDARNELIEGNRLEGERIAGELASNLEVQDFMKKFLSAQTGAQ